MKAVRRKNEEARLPDRARIAGPLNSGETRAIMIGAVVLAIFLYFIKLILLPFVLAGIVAYICTPILDWAEQRTRWPRLVFSVALFLLLFAISIFVVMLAARTLWLMKRRQPPRICRDCWRTFTRQAMGEHPISLFGYTMNAHEVAQVVLERVREWIGQTDLITDPDRLQPRGQSWARS